MRKVNQIFFILCLSALFICEFAAAQTSQISGAVKDTDGAPVVGATIILNGTSAGTVTDVAGNFNISVPAGATEIEISSLGYITQTFAIGAKTTFSITLESDDLVIEEVQVVAYGVQKKETLTGAISSVSNEELTRVPTSSVANILAGQMTGVATVQSSGEPGSDSADIYIRGVATLNDSSPLILIDGVEGDFSQMDGSEIESITVLKDASATAVFGVRGANGVILVTTRSGNLGAPKISLTSSFGLTSYTRQLETAGSYEYATLYNEKNVNDGLDPTFDDYTLERFRLGDDPLMYPDTDWYDYLFNDFSMQTKYNVNISGGTEKVKYFVSAGYLYQNGLLKQFDIWDYDNNYKYNRYNYRSNLDIQVTKTTQLKVNVGGILASQYSPIGNSSDGLWRELNYAHPFSSPGIVDGVVVLNDGEYFGNLELKNGFKPIYGNGYTENNTNTLTTNLELTQSLDFITKGLSAGIKGSYNSKYNVKKTRSANYQTYTIHYQSYLESGVLPGEAGSDYNYNYVYEIDGDDTPHLGYSESYGKDRNYYMEASIRYANQFNSDHNVTGLLLYNQSKDFYPKYFTESPESYVGLVGRITYDYKTKYMVEFNAGYNGSENFAEDKRYGFFPSGSIGWVLTQEDFLKNNSVVDYMKIRGSLGKVGSDNMYDSDGNSYRYLYLPDTYVVDSGSYSFGVDTSTPLAMAYESSMGNPDVTWETAVKMNIGLDINLFKSKLKIAADYFTEHRSDILISRNVVPSLTLDSSLLPVVNMGEVENKGYEIDVRWADQVSSDFSYWINTNVSFARNKILFMDEVEPNEPYMAQTGQSLYTNYGYIADGFYSESDFNDGVLNSDLPQSQYTVYAGDVKYVDLNEDGLIDSNDMTYQGYSSIPEYVFGLNYGVNIKGFDISMNWTGVTNRTVSISGQYRNAFGATGTRGLLSYMIDGRWTPETADTATLPRFATTSATNNYQNSSLWFKDGSYLRLKSARVGYTFRNTAELNRLGISALSLSLSGYNLLTLDYLGWIDPETTVSNSSSYPITQTFNFEIGITF